MEFDWALALGLVLTAVMAASAAVVLAGVLQARGERWPTLSEEWVRRAGERARRRQ